MLTQAKKMEEIRMRDDRIVALFKSGKTRAEIVETLQSEGFQCTIHVLNNRRGALRKAKRLPPYERPNLDCVVEFKPRDYSNRKNQFKADPRLDHLVIEYVASGISRREMSSKLSELGITRTIPALDSLITRLRLAGLIPRPEPKAPSDDDEADEAEPHISTEAMRLCLGGCRNKFLSDGPANRICGQCSTHTAYICAGVDHRFVGSGL
jgi:hypothetical protein